MHLAYYKRLNLNGLILCFFKCLLSVFKIFANSLYSVYLNNAASKKQFVLEKMKKDIFIDRVLQIRVYLIDFRNTVCYHMKLCNIKQLGFNLFLLTF